MFQNTTNTSFSFKSKHVPLYSPEKVGETLRTAEQGIRAPSGLELIGFSVSRCGWSGSKPHPLQLSFQCSLVPLLIHLTFPQPHMIRSSQFISFLKFNLCTKSTCTNPKEKGQAWSLWKPEFVCQDRKPCLPGFILTKGA